MCRIVELVLFVIQEGYEEKESAIQTKIDGVRDTRTKLEQSQQMKKKMMVGLDII